MLFNSFNTGFDRIAGEPLSYILLGNMNTFCCEHFGKYPVSNWLAVNQNTVTVEYDKFSFHIFTAPAFDLP